MLILHNYLFRDIDYNQFTRGGWAKLVDAVNQVNSKEGASQLKLIGRPTIESDDNSEQSDN